MGVSIYLIFSVGVVKKRHLNAYSSKVIDLIVQSEIWGVGLF